MNDLFILIYDVGLSFNAGCGIPCKFCVQGRRRLFRALLSCVTVTVVRGDDIDAMARVTTDQLRMKRQRKRLKDGKIQGHNGSHRTNCGWKRQKKVERWQKTETYLRWSGCHWCLCCKRKSRKPSLLKGCLCFFCQLAGINVGHNAKARHGQFSVCYKNTKSLLCKISLKPRPSQDLLKTLFLHRQISNEQMPAAIILLNQGWAGQALSGRQSVTFNGLRPNVPSQYLPSTPNTHKYPVFDQHLSGSFIIVTTPLLPIDQFAVEHAHN